MERTVGVAKPCGSQTVGSQHADFRDDVFHQSISAVIICLANACAVGETFVDVVDGNLTTH